MLIYLLRRLLYAVPIALAVGFVCFMLVQIAPGDPINAIVPADAPKEVADMLRRAYGLDQPLPVQFWLWLTHVAQGDLGRSLATGRPVTADLANAVGNTLVLAVAAVPELTLHKAQTESQSYASTYHGNCVAKYDSSAKLCPPCHPCNCRFA